MLQRRHDVKQITVAVAAACLVAITASVASASRFSDCKVAALSRYSEAVATLNVDDARKAFIESRACDRFISELPKEEQEKAKSFQEEMYKFQMEESRLKKS